MLARMSRKGNPWVPPVKKYGCSKKKTENLTYEPVISLWVVYSKKTKSLSQKAIWTLLLITVSIIIKA